MGWFDEQIKERKLRDDEAVEDSLMDIAGFIVGKRLGRKPGNDGKEALADILRYYRINIRQLPSEFKGIKDINGQIDYVLRSHGIMSRTVRLEKGWYKDAGGAMLARRSDTETLISLLPGHLGGYTFFDEKIGKNVKVNASNEKLIDDEAIAFYIPFPLKKIGFAELGKYILTLFEPYDFLTVAFAALAVTLIGMIAPVLNRILFSDVISSGSVRLLLSVSSFLFLSTAAGILIRSFQTLATARLNAKLSFNVEAASMMRILSLPASFFKNYASGDLSNRSRQIKQLCTILVNMVFSSTLTGVFSLMYITQIFAFAPSLAAPSLGVLFITVAISIFAALWDMKRTERRMSLESRESGVVHSMLTGIRKIKLAGAEKRSFARWGEIYADVCEAKYGIPVFLKTHRVIITAVNLVGTVVIYYAAVRNNVGAADYYAFNASFAMIAGAFTSFAGIALNIAQIKPIADMCRPILDAVPETSENRGIVTHLSGGIELNNITFRYSNDMPPVLDNLSLKIRPGQYTAVVGRTGCGKSTLARIMLGFETPEKGAVYYDGRDISTLELGSLRRNIGTVLQNGKLMQGDIFSNIVISAPWLTLDDAWEAAEIAGIADDIRSMPMGMQTVVSEGTGGISGGQRQRLMIARAVAPKPKVLIFDEATSALDNITQKKISLALDNLKCTRIVIAHRLSTIQQCDRVLVLEGGRIIEDGSYNELIAKGGFFADLVERQRHCFTN